MTDYTIVDGLIISKWSRQVFSDMKAGGITAANCTCSVWDGFRGTMENIALWKQWFVSHADLITQVYEVKDIRRAKQQGRVGIILGWQNTSAIEDDIGLLPLFHELGIRIAQLTYNNQNYSGSGCWETRDGGVTDFGREMISALNDHRILIDLSHVGPQTSRDTIELSRQPVAYTHCAPMALKQYPRNKTDEELRTIVDRGGFVGFAAYPRFLPQGEATTVDDCVAALEYMVDLLGEDRVGIGTDFTQDQDAAFFDYLRQDKGKNGFRVPGRGTGGIHPKGLQSLAEYGNFVIAMERRGWKSERMAKVLGENWISFLGDIWGDT